MPLVLGIDEAGYGPLLGPLVIGATLWRVRPAVDTLDFWEALRDAVCRTAARGEPRLPVNDSKQVFDRHRGLSTLERTVLAFASVAGLRCDGLANLLTDLSFVAPDSAACPWYANLALPLPTDAARSAFAGAAERLRHAMDAAGVACCGLRAEILTEDSFNLRIAQTRNKASVLLDAVLRLVAWAGRKSAGQDLHVWVDRLGGRSDYRDRLMQAFPDAHLHVLELSPTLSRYRLACPDHDWYLEFAVEGEQRHLPIALASMVAKYVRELLMTRFNAYWCASAPGLVPTAGYYTDAQRFLAAIGPVAQQHGPPLERFVRAR